MFEEVFYSIQGTWSFGADSLGKWWAQQDLNLRPTGYEPVALPTELCALRHRKPNIRKQSHKNVNNKKSHHAIFSLFAAVFSSELNVNSNHCIKAYTLKRTSTAE